MHEIGHIRTRDFEPEDRQAPHPHAIPSGVRFVGQLWRAHHRSVEAAFFETALHGGGISHNGREKQSAEGRLEEQSNL